MNAVKNLVTKISQLTTEIETKYPELYRYLDENPMTIPASGHPEMSSEILTEYLVSLEQILQHFIETHRN